MRVGPCPEHVHQLLWTHGDDGSGWSPSGDGSSVGDERGCGTVTSPVLSAALDPVGSVPGSWRDRAIRAGRPSALLRREALDARAAAALHVAPSQPPQVGKLCLTGIVNVGPGMVSCVMVRGCEFLLC